MQDEPRTTASPLYVMGQLLRAIDALVMGETAADRARAEAKIARWRSVLAGMADGSLSAGSRTPVAGTPMWVTLEVARGGFATRRFLAEMPPDTEELGLVTELPESELTGRERVNLWYLSDAGQQQLRQMLADGRYRVDVPEEAALPIVAWLLDHSHFEAALDLVSELRPWMTGSGSPLGPSPNPARPGRWFGSKRRVRPRPP